MVKQLKKDVKETEKAINKEEKEIKKEIKEKEKEIENEFYKEKKILERNEDYMINQYKDDVKDLSKLVKDLPS